MSRRNAFLTILLFALCFFALGKAPRLPERMGQETLTMAAREMGLQPGEGADGRRPRERSPQAH